MEWTGRPKCRREKEVQRKRTTARPRVQVLFPIPRDVSRQLGASLEQQAELSEEETHS